MADKLDTFRKSERYVEIMKEYEHYSTLSPDEYYALRLLNLAFETKIKLLDTEKTFLAEYVIEAINNKKMLCDLEQYISSTNLSELLNGIACVHEIGFRTRNLEKLNDNFYSKIEAIQVNMVQGHVIENDQRIRIQEYAILHDLAQLSSVLNQLSRLGLVNEALAKMTDKANLCHAMEKAVQLKIKVESHFQPKMFGSSETLLHFFGHLSRLLIEISREVGQAPKISPPGS